MTALIIILPMSLAYGLIYWRWRQLWPLIVAHALEMLYSLLRMYYQQRLEFSLSSYGMIWLFAELAAILLWLLLAWRSRKHTILKSA